MPRRDEEYKQLLKKQLFGSRKELDRLRKQELLKELKESVATPIEYAKKTYKLFPKDIFPTVSWDDIKRMFRDNGYGARTEQTYHNIKQGKSVTPAAKLNKAVIDTGKDVASVITYIISNAPEVLYDTAKTAASAVGGAAGSIYEGVKELPKNIKRIYQDIDLAITSPEVKRVKRKIGKALGFYPGKTSLSAKEYEDYLKKLSSVIKDYRKEKTK